MAQSKSKKTIQSAIYKATTPKDKTPKEKHVRVIVTKTFVKDGSNEEIIKALTKRLDKSHWAVVLKSLMIFHRCFKDGDPSFIDSLRTRSGIVFALRKFSTSTAANNAYTLFVKKYAKYLEEKVSVLRLMNLQFEQVKDVCKGIKPPKAFKVVPKLQSQLNALLNCKMRSQHAGINNLISRTYILLLQDSLPLYSHLNDGIHSLLDLFWKMPKKDATRVVDIYKLYVKETDALIGLYEIGRRYVNKLPAVPKAETSIVDQMEEYAKNAPVGDGDYEEEPDAEPSNNLNYLMSTPGGNNSDDEAPAGHDSSGGTSSSDDGDEVDPFASFISGTSANPFASFSFNVPTLVQPTLYQPAPVATTQPAFGATNNPFVTTPATFQPGLQSNPFAVQTGNPFAIAPAGSVTQPALVLSNPGMTTNNPFLTTPVTYSAPAVTQPVYNPNVTQPKPGGNPFATNNPFL